MTDATIETVTSQALHLKIEEMRRLQRAAKARYLRAVEDMQFAEDFEDVDEYYRALERADMAHRLADIYGQEVADLRRQRAEGWVV